MIIENGDTCNGQSRQVEGRNRNDITAQTFIENQFQFRQADVNHNRIKSRRTGVTHIGKDAVLGSRRSSNGSIRCDPVGCSGTFQTGIDLLECKPSIILGAVFVPAECIIDLIDHIISRVFQREQITGIIE